METKRINAVLDYLGICAEHPGYQFLSHGIYLSMHSIPKIPSGLNALYCQIAEHYNVSYSTVEHGVLTVMRCSWNLESARLFHELIGYPAREKMTAKELIYVLAEFLAQSA